MEFKKDQFYITADAVVFTILKDQLKLLLIKRKLPPHKGSYALPGGFVNLDEGLYDACKRELEEETGVKDIYLKKLKVYGNPKRDPRARVITVPFLALIDSEELKLHAGDDAELANWHSAYRLPELAFDHDKIVEDALHQLRYEIQTTNIANQLMPERFTLTELQRAYEIILDKPLDKRNFRKRIDYLKLVKPLNETKMDGAHRPAKLYSFKNKKYETMREKIYVLM
ncbi:NUDIX hydrolase [Candidatus Woesearchaeota archaeon]|nr:NUDIX hydrolase [Candidatus Woesearchaeota archaeon]